MLLIVSDLDGTLLDADTYSFAAAEPALARLHRAGVPLVLCSSKTRAEIEALLTQLGIDEPFVSENGGAIYLPESSWAGAETLGQHVGGRIRIELGWAYPEVVAHVRDAARDQNVLIRGFADMSVDDITRECGLAPLQAQLAKLREYDEPFRILDPDPAAGSRLLKALHRRGLRTVQGGRYHHATGDTDKGMAVEVLRLLFAGRGPVTMVGLGDAPNDVALLRAVDLPVIVRNDHQDAAGRLLRKVPTARVTERPGPAGWAHAVSHILDDWEAGRLNPGRAEHRV